MLNGTYVLPQMLEDAASGGGALPGDYRLNYTGNVCSEDFVGAVWVWRYIDGRCIEVWLYITHEEDEKCIQNFSLSTLREETKLGDLEINVRIILKWTLEKLRCEDVDSTHLAKDRNNKRANLNAAMNFRVH
jgi:hypothetical protein